MIQPHCHTREWIESQRETIRASDPTILERAIFALTFLAALSRTELDFIFKGGTSLLLHLPRPQRLSIDIDIVCDTEKAPLEKVLESLLAGTPFTRWEEHVRGGHRLPKRLHYKFFYPSPLRPGSETHILLDIVTEKNVIQDIVEKPIEIAFLELTQPVKVKTPSVNALLGDKLTAFAPNTIGVPLTDRYSQQVIKQLFDIGQLYELSTDLAAVAEANIVIHEAESSYRETATSYSDYLQDVIQTSHQICALDLRGAEETDATALLRRGINQLPNHLIDCKFKLPQAKIAAAKAAALASFLRCQKMPDKLPVFDKGQVFSLQDHVLQDEYKILQKLKAILPEAYFYWAGIDCKNL